MNHNVPEKMWFNDPTVLLKSWTIIPNQEMTNAERLNTITRLLLVVVIGMIILGFDCWVSVLCIGLILIVILKSTMGGEDGARREGFQPHRGGQPACPCGQDSSMAYINSKYEQSPLTPFTHVNYGPRSYTTAKYAVKPLYVPAAAREQWQNEPRYCNEFASTPASYNIIPGPGATGPSRKCHFEDYTWIDNTPTGIFPDLRPRSAMTAVQSAFMRDSLEFRNNIMGEYVDFFGKQRQHACVGFKPGRQTW